MAANLLQQGAGGTASRQIDNVLASHTSGDICYEKGFYGIAADSVAVGGSMRMYLDCIAQVTVPGGSAEGALLGGPSKPTGPITLVAGGAVPLGVQTSAIFADGTAKVQFFPAKSAGL